jgi:hypothetical protein
MTAYLRAVATAIVNSIRRVVSDIDAGIFNARWP